MPAPFIDVGRLRALWAAGRTKQEIADALGASLGGVKFAVRRHALPPRFKGWHPAGYAERMSAIFKKKYISAPRPKRLGRQQCGFCGIWFQPKAASRRYCGRRCARLFDAKRRTV